MLALGTRAALTLATVLSLASCTGSDPSGGPAPGETASSADSGSTGTPITINGNDALTLGDAVEQLQSDGIDDVALIGGSAGAGGCNGERWWLPTPQPARQSSAVPYPGGKVTPCSRR